MIVHLDITGFILDLSTNGLPIKQVLEIVKKNTVEEETESEDK